jgi:predicted anti-sigma-YlaC factor YlaD
MLDKIQAAEIDCYEARRELVDYMESDLAADLRDQIDQHLLSCEQCTAIYDGARNVVQLIGNENAFELPPGFSRRLHRLLLCRLQNIAS